MSNNILNWKYLLKNEKKKYFLDIIRFLSKERLKKIIYPPHSEIFTAFLLTEFSSIKVVILGQDPYHNFNQAHGLAFSVNIGATIPPSLKNIYKEISNDMLLNYVFQNGLLKNWAKQGVLLLNTILTVESGKPGSHSQIGWTFFTDKVIEVINKYLYGVVFLLWGSHAKNKVGIIDGNKHYILQASHPSPLSAYRGFFGCRHFSKTNQILIKQGKRPINWFA
ncbi:Uracil-DNA glycosylase [Buchnera aphidicola (Pemphigus populi)]